MVMGVGESEFFWGGPLALHPPLPSLALQPVEESRPVVLKDRRGEGPWVLEDGCGCLNSD